MKVFASCHNHSCYSDAEYTPDQLADIAKSLGHGGIILTDHDTVSGSYFMSVAARKRGMKSILGCEFTTYYKGEAVHLLGFDFNTNNKAIKDILAYGSSVQTSRTEVLFHLGLERGSLREGVTWQEVRDAFPYNDYICNNQVFKVMEQKGIYRHEEYETEFFERNFSGALKLSSVVRGITGKSYRDQHTEDVIRAIRDAGGVPVVAHPAGMEQYAKELVELGVMGFETRHACFREENGHGGEASRLFWERVCEEHNLYKMGGSDHEGILGGYLEFGDAYVCPEELSGISEEDFMNIYERRLG